MSGQNLSITEKIPKLHDIVPVYAVIVMIIYPWTLARFFWRLPSWLYFSSVGEIAVIFAYMMVVNLIESVLVLLAPLLLSIILPQKWFYDRFMPKGILLVLFGLGYFMYFASQFQYQTPFPVELVSWTPAIAIAILGLVFLIDRFRFLDRILAELSSRLLIFLYISIPVSLVSLLVVLIRNII
jgi:hypothetical protein